MHFTHRQDNGILTIVAGLKDEHGDVTTGLRIQDDRHRLELTETRVEYGLALQDIDLDHLALASCLLFLPFIGRTVTFRYPVCSELAAFLADPGLAKFRGRPPIRVGSKVYGPRARREMTGLDGCLLSIGGGFDAVGIKTLIPELKTYHIVSAFARNLVYHYPAYRFYQRRDQIHLAGRPLADTYVWSTAENIVEPRGLTTWANFAIPALLMSADTQAHTVVSGTIFESAFLENGKRYRPPRQDENSNGFNEDVFERIGLRLVAGATMMPEYVTACEVFRHGLGDDLSFCIMGPAGGPCSQCFKCYRKKLLYETYKSRHDIDVPQFEAMDIARFDTSYVQRLADAVPMYFSSSFKWMQERVEPRFIIPSLAASLARVPEVRFDLGRVYPPGLEALPGDLRQHFAARLSERYELMSPDEISAVAAFDAG